MSDRSRPSWRDADVLVRTYRDAARTRPRDTSATTQPWWQTEGLALAVLAIVTAVAIGQVLFRGTLMGQDSATQFYPWYDYLGERLLAGEIPGWNPHQFSGAPFAADPQSGWMYLPTMVIFTLLSLPAAVPAFLIFHMALAGGATYALARLMRLGVSGALVAAIAYELSGPVYGRSVCCAAGFEVATWTPVVLVGAELAMQRRDLTGLRGLDAGLGQVRLDFRHRPAGLGGHRGGRRLVFLARAGHGHLVHRLRAGRRCASRAGLRLGLVPALPRHDAVLVQPLDALEGDVGQLRRGLGAQPLLLGGADLLLAGAGVGLAPQRAGGITRALGLRELGPEFGALEGEEQVAPRHGLPELHGDGVHAAGHLGRDVDLRGLDLALEDDGRGTERQPEADDEEGGGHAGSGDDDGTRGAHGEIFASARAS